MSSGRLRSWGLVGVGVIAGLSISYGLTAYAFRDARGPIPLEEIREFTEVFGAIKANYVEPVEDRKLMQEAISGMLAGLDPHSAFLDADAFKDLQVGTQGEFGGLGIEVGAEDGAVRVIAPIDDTPAARAGIRAGDLIIKIDDKFTRGMALGDAIKLMRGKPKTPITLTLVRKGENAPLEVKLMRDVIRVQSVKSKVIEPGYAFVRITQFQERTVDDLAKQLGDLYKQGPLKGVVLDLRNDPGGLLHAAVGVSAVFLPGDATVVTTEGRTEDAHRRYAANPSDYQRTHGDDALAHLPPQIKSVPLVVLVNGASASASEIVAGALQDHKRGTLIGTQTFGKGSVQTIIPIRNDRDNPTAIKLTTARYYTPSGRSIQAHATLEPEYYGDVDAQKYGERKPLIWFWMMFDRSPAGLNHWLGYRVRYMLAKHIFKHLGKNVKIFHGVEVSYGYNLTVEDNCTIHKYVLLDDRGEIIIHEGSSISDYANVYSHEHDLNDGMIVTNTKTEIGPRARVTYHATVMSGVRIHEHGLVGSLGVATKDVPPFTISAGIPAKPIKVKTIAPQPEPSGTESGA